MSDGSAFQGQLVVTNSDLFAVSGLNIVLARDLTSADDGVHPTTIIAVYNGQVTRTNVSFTASSAGTGTTALPALPPKPLVPKHKPRGIQP